MIKYVSEIDTSTNEGRLALSLVALITGEFKTEKTPEEVIDVANSLIPVMFDGKPEPLTAGMIAHVAHLSTKELVDELRKRAGVEAVDIDYERNYFVQDAETDTNVAGEGPAIILVVTD